MRSNILKARALLSSWIETPAMDRYSKFPQATAEDIMQEALFNMTRAKHLRRGSTSFPWKATREVVAEVKRLAALAIPYTNSEIAQQVLGHASRSGRVTDILQGKYDHVE